MPIRPSAPPRRSFLQRLGATAAALTLGALPRTGVAQREGTDPDADAWLARITGKHRQLFDCASPAGGFGVAYALNYMDAYNRVHALPDRDVTAVVVFRHLAALLALNDAMWAKYALGAAHAITDPATSQPATRNVFRDAVPGRDRATTYERLIADRGLIVTACHQALEGLAGAAAARTGAKADDVAREWLANVIPGVIVVPSGVYAVNRAQEKGCTYCFGG